MKGTHQIITFLAVALLLLSTGCQRGKDAAASDVLTIALVMKTLNNPFFIDMETGAREAAGKLGVQLLIQAPDREADVEKQMQVIENLIQRKVSAICIAPSGSKEIVPAIVKANRAGIPVLIIDTRVDSIALAEAGGRVASFIGSDNFQGGRIAGEFIVEQLAGRGKVAILEGIPGHETGDARLGGFHQVVSQAPGIEIVASQTANWERGQGYNVFQNILQSHPEVQALFACNDLMALGAIEALAAAGRSGDLLVVGFDAIEDAREAIAAGTMAGSVAQHPAEMGKFAVEFAHGLLRGETIPENFPVPVELITRQNVAASPTAANN
ncbi:MAG: substrate-binding domain-containing protein [Candidatus Marinimicrobia bacterium]|nr:substrate-binding domain-containing protein [Candidatus Neomarinimicrobiota bacterium]